MKSIVILGKGDLAIYAGERFLELPDAQIEAVVPVTPEPNWTGSLTRWAESRSLRVVPSGDYLDLPEGGFDLGLSVFYDRILPASFIERFKRLLNLHNSPLPRYRGVRPINWALRNGEREHGVTIHEITPGIDDGPIVSQVRFPIHPPVDEVEDVYRRAEDHARLLLDFTIPIIEQRPATPQDEAEATYYSLDDSRRLGDRSDFRRG